MGGGALSGPEFTHPVVYVLRTKTCVGKLKLSSNLTRKGRAGMTKWTDEFGNSYFSVLKGSSRSRSEKKPTRAFSYAKVLHFKTRPLRPLWGSKREGHGHSRVESLLSQG